MAKIIAGVGHVAYPGHRRGARQRQDRRALLEAGVRRASSAPRSWIEELKPDVVILVYNDHASAFSLEMIPTFALGCAADFPLADEGWGPRPVPVVKGHPELAWHIAQSLVLDEFDITIVNKMDVDHGLTVPLSLMFGQPKEWPCPVDPALRQCGAIPAANRPSLLHAGQGHPQSGGELRSGSAGGRSSAPAACRISCRARAPASSTRNSTTRFLDNLTRDPVGLTAIPHIEYLREAGSEGIEMVMWLIMRGALDDEVRGSLPLLSRAGVEHRAGPHHPGKPASRQGIRHEDLSWPARAPSVRTSGRAEEHPRRRSGLAGRRQCRRHRGRWRRNTASRIGRWILRESLKQPGVDAVILATPTQMHADQGEQVHARGQACA